LEIIAVHKATGSIVETVAGNPRAINIDIIISDHCSARAVHIREIENIDIDTASAQIIHTGSADIIEIIVPVSIA